MCRQLGKDWVLCRLKAYVFRCRHFYVEAIEVLVGQAQCLSVYQIKKFGYTITLP
jgi:hypothetical protein